MSDNQSNKQNDKGATNQFTERKKTSNQTKMKKKKHANQQATRNSSDGTQRRYTREHTPLHSPSLPPPLLKINYTQHTVETPRALLQEKISSTSGSCRAGRGQPTITRCARYKTHAKKVMAPCERTNRSCSPLWCLICFAESLQGAKTATTQRQSSVRTLPSTASKYHLLFMSWRLWRGEWYNCSQRQAVCVPYPR